MADIGAAVAGKKALPEKALLLTFDDGYLSFYRIAFPALKALGYPAVLSVVTSWVDGRDNPGSPWKEKGFMNWDQIREVAASGLVTVASHSDDLHTFVDSNPQGNIDPSATTFMFEKKGGFYETEERYRRRISHDMEKSLSIFEKKLGIRPIVYAWPYNAYNTPATEEGKKAGFRMFLTMDEGLADIRRLDRVNRYYAQTCATGYPPLTR